jgi:hypothetical protein
LTIEVQEPAPVTFPLDIANLLVVNNSVTQPNDIGINRNYKGLTINGYELDLDSVAWIASASLASHIRETNFFSAVSFYTKPVRDDNEWLVAAPLSKAFREEIFEQRNFDGIISIDRILINLDERVSTNEEGETLFDRILFGQEVAVERDTLKRPNLTKYKSIEAKVQAKLICSVYLYERENPLTTFTVSDSLSFRDIFFENRDVSTIFKELPEALIDELAYNMGENLIYYFTPSWVLKERTIYTGYNSRMQEAFSFSRTGKWDKAEVLWMNEYDKTSKPSDKGKRANNIAIANELQDKLETALRWAEIAKESFQESGLKATSDEFVRINAYITDLQKRIKDDRLLNIQWGTIHTATP